MTSNNHAAIKGFSWKCWKARDRPFSANPDGRFNISMLVKPDGPCVAVGHPPELIMPLRRTRDLERMDYQSIYQKSGDSSQKLQRSKRAWMIPGTLWCGSGNKASAFSDLGLSNISILILCLLCRMVSDRYLVKPVLLYPRFI